MSRQPESAEQLLDEAEAALDIGDAEQAIERCGEALALSPDHPGAHFVRGDAFRLLGRLPEAADDYRAAALGRPDHASSWASLALTSFEILDIPEAERASNRAVREDPDNPEGWWVRSLIREWTRDFEGAQRCQLHACWLDPDSFPLPPKLDDDEIETLVDEALQLLHPNLQELLSNTPILLEESPSEDVLRGFDPPASPLELLGYFAGHSLMERTTEDPWSQMPGAIVLFRRNIQRHTSNRAELVEQLRITLYHEVGHFLGLDEDDLEERGLD